MQGHLGMSSILQLCAIKGASNAVESETIHPHKLEKWKNAKQITSVENLSGFRNAVINLQNG